MQIAYSYRRFSDRKQKKGDSLRRQTAFEQEVCRERGLTLDESLDLSDEGVSALLGKNVRDGALGRFLEAAENNEFPTAGNVLLIENIDRLSRMPPMRALKIFERILELGLTVVTASPRAEYSRALLDSENDSRLFMLVAEMQRAHGESKRKQVLVGRAWEAKRKRALEEGRPMTSICPAWLKVQQGKYVVIPERAEVVRLIFELAGEGMGARRVVAKLTADRVPPMGRKGSWNTSYVKKILNNPAVHGEARHQLHLDGKRNDVGDPIPDFYPAVIGREDFELSRARTRGRKWQVGRPSKGDVSMFGGLMWHVGDRRKMHFRTSDDGRKKRTYVESAAVNDGQPGEAARRFPYPPLEDSLLDALHELRTEDVSAHYRKHRTELDEKIAELNRRVDVAEAKRDELAAEFDAADDAAYRQTLLKLIKSNTERLEADRGELDKARAEADSTRADVLEQTRSLIDLLRKTPDGPEREKLRRRIRTRVRSLLSAIWVHVEQVNRQRRFAHVQLFLKVGGRKYFVVPSFKPTKSYAPIFPRRDFADVDFREYELTEAERVVGRGKRPQRRPPRA